MDRFIREHECRLRTGLARTTRWALERRGLFPMRRRLANNAVGWLESELLEWMKSRETGIGSPPLLKRVDGWPNHAGAACRLGADEQATLPRATGKRASRASNPLSNRSPT